MSQNTKSSNSTRGRKRRTVPEESDPTGRNHSMVVNIQKRIVTGQDSNYKESQYPLSTVEKPVDTVDGLTQEPVVEHDHTTMVNKRQEFAQMVRFYNKRVSRY